MASYIRFGILLVGLLGFVAAPPSFFSGVCFFFLRVVYFLAELINIAIQQ